MAERVAVGLLDGRTCGGADVREEDGRLDVACNLTQVAVVPGRLDAVEDGRAFGILAVPADSETVPVSGLDAETCVEALVDEGVVWFVEQLLEEYRGARVSEPTTQCLLLSFGDVPRGHILAGLGPRAGFLKRRHRL
jgi:hypothetical protein